MHWYRSKERGAVQDIDLRRVCFQVCVCAMCAYGTKSSRWGRWRARRLWSRMSGSLPCGYDLPPVKIPLSERTEKQQKSPCRPWIMLLKTTSEVWKLSDHNRSNTSMKLQGNGVIRRGRNTACSPVLYFKVEGVNERGFVTNKPAQNLRWQNYKKLCGFGCQVMNINRFCVFFCIIILQLTNSVYFLQLPKLKNLISTCFNLNYQI